MSQWWDSNPQPTDYKSVAQPSCSTGKKLRITLRHTAITILKKMVGLSRFELKTQLPKSCVLPLHHRPIKNTIVAEAGLEPARPLLTRRFSYHTCFYTSQLNQASLQPTRLLFSLQEFHHNLILETFD